MARLSAMTAMAFALAIGQVFSMAVADACSSTLDSQKATSTTSFWYPKLNHGDKSTRAFCPDLDGDNEYEVYKEAFHCGGGKHIQQLIDMGTNGAERKPLWLNSQPRVVYLPPGTYEVSETIYMRTDTVLMGDPTNPPVLRASTTFTGQLILLSGMDPAAGLFGETSFAVSLKNIILDTTARSATEEFTALYWGVAQAAHVQNLQIAMPCASGGKGHTGILLGRGSTIAISDVIIDGGQNGIMHAGHQQALYKGIQFHNNAVGLLISDGFTVSLLRPTFENCPQPIVQTGGMDPWISVVDAVANNSGTLLTVNSWPSILIENLSTFNPKTTEVFIHNAAKYNLRLSPYLDRFTYGNGVGQEPTYGPNYSDSPDRPIAAVVDGTSVINVIEENATIVISKPLYPSFPAPNYAHDSVSAFLNVKDPAQNGGRTICGDNNRDEAEALNAILQLAADKNKTAYFPYGKYRVDSTLFIPPGSRIVGEAWATIIAGGHFWSNATDPHPVVQVGKIGDIGVAHIQDMRFTVGEVSPGAIILQFNIKGRQPGDVAIWNSLVTVGGTKGSPNMDSQCNTVSAPCQAAFLGIHFAPGSSVYAENVWAWVADHTIEKNDPKDPSSGVNIAGGRGVLVESKEGTWLNGMGSEHWWLYQLHLRNAENVVVSLLQSETNYDQGIYARKRAPAPWHPLTSWQDPDFSWCPDSIAGLCRMGLGNYINGGENIYTYASASWTFFTGPWFADCGVEKKKGWCQELVHFVVNQPKNLNAFGLCTRDTDVVLRVDGDWGDFLSWQNFSGSWGGLVGRYTTSFLGPKAGGGQTVQT